MGDLKATLFTGCLFDNNCSVIVPKSENHLPAIWCYCSDPAYDKAVRRINQKSSVTDQSLVRVPFDLTHWQKVAAKRYPDGLPEPISNDPTQWLYHGHPAQTECDAAIHVAIARLGGYRWPPEHDTDMRLSAQARDWVGKAASLGSARTDGMLCVPPVAGERALADRLRTYLAAAFGSAWSEAMERRVVNEADERFEKKVPRDGSLEAWLRDRAFKQHCILFSNRPFLWHVWDGQEDGFAAFLNYHHLTQANLERLTFSLRGDWIARTRDTDDNRRLEAALILQGKLGAILRGESPLDIFVRWKPLTAQPIGWNPDLDDGVRLNIRPFVRSGVLRDIPNIHWRKDRGTDLPSAPWYAEFNGERINDHTLTLAQKQAAREAAASRVA
jgi:hypothetical protein